YMVASQEVSYGFTSNSWAYSLKSTPQMDAVQLGKKFVDMYYSSCSAWDDGITAALYDLKKVGTLVTKVDELADVLSAKYSTYKTEIDLARNITETIEGVEHVVLTAYTDLYDLAYNIKSKVPDNTIKAKAQAVMDAVTQVVIYEKHVSYGKNAKVHGINIFYITKTTQGGRFTPAMYHTLNIDFIADTSWDEFVQLAY
ncbi:MAG: clostripain-related cysteine peptidase, partial [Thermoplasmata archaeon]